MPYLLKKSLQRTFTVAHVISFSLQGEHFSIPGFLSKFALVLLWQYHCAITAYLASIELNARFRPRCDAEVEAKQGHQYIMVYVSLVNQYLWENLEQDNRVIFVLW
jgi:hypothetical protein